MGMRLEGGKIENQVSKNIKSEGITKGSIQVPGDGKPIILLSDHPTIGGYPKIANIIILYRILNHLYYLCVYIPKYRLLYL